MTWSMPNVCLFDKGRFIELSHATYSSDTTSNDGHEADPPVEAPHLCATSEMDCVVVVFNGRKSLIDVEKLCASSGGKAVVLLGSLEDEADMVMALEVGAYHYFVREMYTADQFRVALEAILAHHTQALRIRQNKQRLKTLIRTTPAIFWSTDIEGNITYQDGAVQRAGFSVGELLGVSIFEYYADQPQIQQKLRMALSGEEVEFTTERCGRLFRNYVVPLKDFAHKTSGLAAVSIDETERTRLQKDLEIFKAATKASGEAVVVTEAFLESPGPKISYANPAFHAMTGYTEEELVGQNLQMLQGPLSDQHVLERLKTELESGRSFCGETITYRKDGSSFLMAFRVDPVKDNTGIINHFVGIHRDITEMRQRELDLQASEDQFRSFMESSPTSAWIIDLEGRYLYINQTMAEAWGSTKNELIGKSMFEIFPPEIAAEFRDKNVELCERHETALEELTLPKPDGSEWTLLVYRFAMKTTAGNWVIGGTGTDITDRKKAEQALVLSEEALRESVRRYNITVRAAATGLWDWDLKSGTVVYGEWFKKMLGYEEEVVEENIGNFTQILHPNDVDSTWTAINDHLEGRSDYYHAEYRLRSKSGEYLWFAARGEAIRDFEGKPLRLLGASHDITARKITEDALQDRTMQQTVVAELGQLGLEEKDPSLLLDVAAKRVAETLRAPLSTVFEYLPETQELLMRNGHGWQSGLLNTIQIKADKNSLCGLAFVTGKSVVVTDITENPETDIHPKLQEYGIVSCINTAIAGPEEAFGVLGVYCTEVRHFSRDDVKFLESVAHILAASTQRSKAEQRIRRHLGQLDALRTIDIAITGSLDMRVTLSVVISQVVEQLNVDAATVLMLRPGNVLEYAAGRGFRTAHIQSSRVSVSNSVPGNALTMRTVQVIPQLTTSTDFRRSQMVQAEQFTFYVAVPLIARGEPLGVLEVYSRKSFVPNTMWLEFLEALSGQTAIAINNSRMFDQLQTSNLELTMAYDRTLEGWSKALDLRDKETEGHTTRVTEMAETLARAFNMPEDEIVHLRRGALLHDIGKMGIPDSILLKPGKLTEDEWKIMKMHPVYAYELLYPITFLRPALDIPYCHHEKWDGTGYPRGLSGDQIPMAARLFAPVDIWDALTSDRPYRKGWTSAKALKHIVSLSGTHLDPEVVQLFIKHLA